MELQSSLPERHIILKIVVCNLEPQSFSVVHMRKHYKQKHKPSQVEYYTPDKSAKTKALVPTLMPELNTIPLIILYNRGEN